MRKIAAEFKALFSVVLVFALLFSVMPNYAYAAGEDYKFKISKHTITKGGTAEVDVKIELNRVLDIANLSFLLRYRRDVFDVTNADVKLDNDLKELLALESNVVEHKVDKKIGEIRVVGFITKNENITEEQLVNHPIDKPIVVASIKFKAKDNAPLGEYELRLADYSVVRFDENRQVVELQAAHEPGSITIRTGGSRPGQSSDPSKYTGGGDQKPDDQKPDDEKPDDEKPDGEKPDDEKPSDGPTSVDSFEDISESLEWSKPAIDYLVKRGIISGTSENSFEPERSITRAEFTKIIVAAFGFEDTEGDVSFTDVSDDDWYSEFVKIAVKNGLVQGYPEGDFKPNATITREEMATILVRAFKSMGIDVETGDVDFADSDEIGDWAAEYVATLAKLGIVQGRGDNMFVPKDNLTRAEAAVVIYKSIMQLFENQ